MFTKLWVFYHIYKNITARIFYKSRSNFISRISREKNTKIEKGKSKEYMRRAMRQTSVRFLRAKRIKKITTDSFDL